MTDNELQRLRKDVTYRDQVIDQRNAEIKRLRGEAAVLNEAVATLHELQQKTAAERDQLQKRVDQLTGHLDWIYWSSDGVEQRRREYNQLCKLLKEAWPLLRPYKGKSVADEIESQYPWLREVPND